MYPLRSISSKGFSSILLDRTLPLDIVVKVHLTISLLLTLKKYLKLVHQSVRRLPVNTSVRIMFPAERRVLTIGSVPESLASW